MHSSNHKPHASIASSLPWAADTTAAIRRGKLEISYPMPIPHKIPDEPGSRIDGGRHTYQISPTSLGNTDTWPRRGTAPALQDINPQPLDANRAWNGSGFYNNNSARTSAALTNTQQSMSSLPSNGSVRKGGGIRATFRKMFGSKRRRDPFSTDANDHRSVGDTDSILTRTFLSCLQLNQADRSRILFPFSTAQFLPVNIHCGSHRSCLRSSFEAEHLTRMHQIQLSQNQLELSKLASRPFVL